MPTYARLDRANIAATVNESLIKNVRFATKVGGVFTDAPVENGTLVILDSLVPGQNDLYYATLPEATTVASEIYIVSNAEVDSDESQRKNITDYRQEAGRNSFTFKPVNGDTIFVSAEAFATAPDNDTIEGSYVDISTSGKFAISAAPTAGTTLGKVDRTFFEGKQRMYLIRFSYTCA